MCKTWFITVMLLLAVAILNPLMGQDTEEAKLQAIGEKYRYQSFSFDPVYATEMGDYSPEYMYYPGYSKRSLKKQAAALKSIQKQLRKIKQEKLSIDSRIDYLLLQGNIRTNLLFLERSLLIRDNPKLFSSTAINGIYYLLISPSLSDSLKLEYILSRLTDLPRFLTSARKSLKAPPLLWILLSEKETETSLAFFNEVATHFTSQFPARQVEIEAAFTEVATALEGFIDLLDVLKLEEHKSFAFGKENYNRLLREEHFLDFDADSLLHLGEIWLERAMTKYDSVKAICDTLPLTNGPTCFIPRSFSRADILDYFQWEINQSRSWVQESHFAAVPPDIGDCIPVETPKFLRNIIGGIAYQPPGPFEPVQTGLFYVRPLPDSLDETSRSAFFRYAVKRGFKGSTVHEAYPGHHLQIQLANRHSSPIRRLQHNNMGMEGWALYCEETVYEHGFYGDDPRTYLGILGGVLFRAARIVVDVKLHTGQFTYQEAVDWMAAKLDASVGFIEIEVSRYTLNPTQPISYLVGKNLILEIHDLYRSRQGDAYSPQAFHDMLLGNRSIPPVLIYKKLAGEI
ncbi:MAG: DUF885 domain-containing protein [candidate division Zixibacteria bacterium]|nr:DUF885 domain-containing protein [candidate division Zixibacteria bacterium]